MRNLFIYMHKISVMCGSVTKSLECLVSLQLKKLGRKYRTEASTLQEQLNALEAEKPTTSAAGGRL